MSVDFKAVLAASGVPITEQATEQAFRDLAFANSSPFNNQSPYSPFWRLVSLFCVKPVTYITKLLHAEILPALFLKTAKDEWVDLFAWQLGLERKQATHAVGQITLERYSGDGELTIPEGTVIQSDSIGGEVFRLVTIADVTFAAGQTITAVLAKAEEAGSRYNLANGFYAIIATDLSGIARVTNGTNWLLTPGSDLENDDELKERCRVQFASTNPWHIDFAYTAMVTKWPGVDVEDVYIDSDAPRGPGTGDIYILFDQASPADLYLNQIQSHIMANKNHGFSDDVAVMNMPRYDVEQSADIEVNESLTDIEKEQLRVSIEQFIRIAFRELPATYYQPTRTEPNKRFKWSVLVKELHNQFPNLESIDFANDVNLIAQLAQPKLIALTVLVVNEVDE